ncbi:fructose-6-phosphate aldolase [bacterium]|nr:fructose-6-phosphate aldolase [bacterium]
MKLFIDTANIGEIKEAKTLGVLDGVTTNPSLISRENRKSRELLAEICSIVDGPVSAECISEKATEMVAEAKDLAKIADNIVIKIPICKDGMQAVKELTELGIKTNATLCFSSSQALLIAKAGATYVSPFVGRLDDISQYGMELVSEILTIYGNYEIKTEVIVASIRNPVHFVESAIMGAHVATVPFNVIQQLLKHPLTDIGIQRFLDDYRKIPK